MVTIRTPKESAANQTKLYWESKNMKNTKQPLDELELKECLFCGSENPEILEHVKFWGIGCVCGGAMAPVWAKEKTAIKAWNSRSQSANAAEEENKRLRELIERCYKGIAVLRSMLSTAKLTHGVSVTDELLADIIFEQTRKPKEGI